MSNVESYEYTITWREFGEESTAVFTYASHGAEYEVSVYRILYDLSVRSIVPTVARRLLTPDLEEQDLVQYMRTARTIVQFATDVHVVYDRKITMIKALRNAHPSIGLKQAKQMIEVATASIAP